MHRYVLPILDKEVNETSASSPVEIPSTPKVARAVHFDNNEAPPNSYGDINAPGPQAQANYSTPQCYIITTYDLPRSNLQDTLPILTLKIKCIH